MGDDLASFSRNDTVAELDVFRKSGYSEQQIEDLYVEIMRQRDGATIELPRQVRATITVLKRSWGGGKKRHAPAKRKTAKPRRHAKRKARKSHVGLIAAAKAFKAALRS